HVEYHDVRPQILRKLHGLPAVLRLRDYLPTWHFREGRGDAGSNELVVVGDEYPYCFYSSVRGSVARTIVPEPPASTVNVPPTCRTRSRMPARPTPSGKEPAEAPGERPPSPPSSISSSTESRRSRRRTDAHGLSA